WRWEKRFDSRLDKQINVKVPDEHERSILRKVVELRAAGHSFDKIRQHLSYAMKVKTRLGGDWTKGRIATLFAQGLRLMAETSLRTEAQNLASANGQAEYGGLMESEDESP